MTLAPHRHIALRVLTFNTHVGLAIRYGGLDWLLAKYPHVDIVCLQELEWPWSKIAARRRFPRKDWIAVGGSAVSRSGTYVFARRARFELVDQANDLLSAGRDRMHPVRKLTAALLRDKVSGRLVDATCVHTWAWAGAGRSPGDVANGHQGQVRAYRAHAATVPAGAVCIAAGDFNERIGDPAGGARQALLSVGLEPAYALAKFEDGTIANLDEVFVRTAPFVDVRAREEVAVPFRGVDHPAVFVRLRVTPV